MSDESVFTSLSQMRPVKLSYEKVHVPELGTVLVWELDGGEVEEWKGGHLKTKGGKVVGLNLNTATARLLAKAIKNESGERFLNLADAQQLVRRLSAKSLAKLDSAARRLSGLDSEDDEDAEGEDSAPGGPSTIDSPSLSDAELETSY